MSAICCWKVDLERPLLAVSVTTFSPVLTSTTVRPRSGKRSGRSAKTASGVGQQRCVCVCAGAGAFTYLRTGWASLLRGSGIPPPAEAAALGRGRPLRGGARERAGVEVLEARVDVAFTGCFRASGDGVAGVRSLLGEGTGDRRAAQSRMSQRDNKMPLLHHEWWAQLFHVLPNTHVLAAKTHSWSSHTWRFEKHSTKITMILKEKK